MAIAAAFTEVAAPLVSGVSPQKISVPLQHDFKSRICLEKDPRALDVRAVAEMLGFQAINQCERHGKKARVGNSEVYVQGIENGINMQYRTQNGVFYGCEVQKTNDGASSAAFYVRNGHEKTVTYWDSAGFRIPEFWTIVPPADPLFVDITGLRLLQSYSRLTVQDVAEIGANYVAAHWAREHSVDSRQLIGLMNVIRLAHRLNMTDDLSVGTIIFAFDQYDFPAELSIKGISGEIGVTDSLDLSHEPCAYVTVLKKQKGIAEIRYELGGVKEDERRMRASIQTTLEMI